jgi:Fic family protein
MSSIEKAIQLKSELDGLRPISKEKEALIMQKFRLDWDYHSNHLEGNSLTFGETKALILFGITAQGKPLKDHFEITGHNEAITWIIDIVKGDYPLTENFIRQLHVLLLKEPYEVDAITPDGEPTKKRVEVGKYKTLTNHVKTATGEIFRFAEPEETPAMMNDLINWYREKRNDPEVNPIILASEFHYRFIRIHPFDDGNGRVARLLMNFILMQFSYPPVIIKTEDKANYFFALRQADAGTIEPFIEYIAKNLIRSIDIMISGAKGQNIQEPDDLDKEIALLEQRVKSKGKKLEIERSKEAILTIYDDSVSRLTEEFLKACEKFDKFYVDTIFHLYVNGSSSIREKFDVFKTSRANINGNTQTMALQYDFIAFNQQGFGEFSHNSAIIFKFGYASYTVKALRATDFIEKGYDEQLTEEEISEIVKFETTLHKNVIEQKLKQFDSKKK